MKRFVPRLLSSSVVVGMAIGGLVGSAITAHAANPEHVRQLLRTGDCPNCDLSSTVLENINLSEANLQGANLSDTQLIGVQLIRANLSDANLNGALFQGVDLTGAVLENADLSNVASLSPCRDNLDSLYDEIPWETKECVLYLLTARYIPQSCFGDSSIGHLFAEVLSSFDSLSEACSAYLYEEFETNAYPDRNPPALTALGANFDGANLSDASLSEAELSYSSFNNARALRADFSYAMMFYTQTENIQDADLNDAWQSEEELARWLVETQAGIQESERRAFGQTYIRIANLTQQAYYFEHERFIETADEIPLGPEGEGDILFETGIAAVSEYGAVHYALSQREDLPSVVGIVRAFDASGRVSAVRENFSSPFSSIGNIHTFSLMCEADEPGLMIVQDLPDVDISSIADVFIDRNCPTGWTEFRGF